MSVTNLGPLFAGGSRLPVLAEPVPAGYRASADISPRHVSLDELFDIRGSHMCLMKVQDDSMDGAGICHGDLVLVDRSVYAEHGDIVVAAFNSQPICKRLYMRGEAVMLQSENPRHPPRKVTETDDLVIWGVVKYSVRGHGAV